MSCPIIPDLPARSLQEVIPVAKQVRNQEVNVTVTSLEHYSGGFAVNTRIDWKGVRGPQLKWSAIDDRGGQHFCPGCSGGGWGPPPPNRLMRWIYRIPVVNGLVMNWNNNRPRAQSWRMHCPFSYAIPPEATELTLDVGSFGLTMALTKDDRARDDKHKGRMRDSEPLGSIVVPLVPRP